MSMVLIAGLVCRGVLAGEKFDLGIGEARRLTAPAAAAWASSDPAVATVYANGFVVGLKEGRTIVSPGDWQVRVIPPPKEAGNATSLKQFPDDRQFLVDGRKCFGSELNGKMTGEKLDNRVENPKPLNPKKPQEWELTDPAPVYDGIGVLMGTVAATGKRDGKKVPVTKINYGMSKVIARRLCVYGFSFSMTPDPGLLGKDIDPAEVKNGVIGNSAWIPLDCVVEKEQLLELAGIGMGKLPRLPLSETRYGITGGDPRMYMTEVGQELSIVRDVDSGPVPSHYLRRPCGTINIIYSVPGFGLGGQSLDSILISNKPTFRPVDAARKFVMPTYYPDGVALKGKKTEKTMTFLYGAVEVEGSDPIYGWVAKEALEPLTKE
jgi:hypothetical protein